MLRKFKRDDWGISPNQPTTTLLWASAATFGGAEMIPGPGSLVRCEYCGRVNQFELRAGCPGCGAPMRPLSDV